MPQKKISIDPSRQIEISIILKKKNFMILDNDYAFWRAISSGISIIFYKNGSVLFQGSDSSINEILTAIEGFLSPADENTRLKYPVLGLDESGKGDYFGPLVLSAALLGAVEEKEAIRKGVMDSKKITDRSIRKIYSEIKGSIAHKVRIIEPQEYNVLYKKFGNLNLLMASEYAELVRKFHGQSFNTVILDKFSNSESLNRGFRENINCETIIVEKGERYTSVAAASVFARFCFINWIDEKSSMLGYILPKGSGNNASRLFQNLKSEMSPENFESIAKIHFKVKDLQ